MRSPEKLLSIAALTLVTWATAACGGAFDGGGDDDGGSGGQAGGSGGQAGGGKAGAGSAGRAGSGSGASSGTGSGGASGGGCEWLGNVYPIGASFPAGDGCNTCTCGDNGSVGCTEADCDECSDIENAYAPAFEQAKTCDPQQANPCSEVAVVGLQCGCESFVNPEAADAIAILAQALQDYIDLSCGGEVFCEQCLPPTSAYCSAEGRCVDVYEVPSGASCKVEGVVYPNGSSGVPDPFSCNTCDCLAGQLICTEINCPEPCPVDTAPSTQCAQCGPADGCEVQEHGCLPVCVDDLCQSGACIDGVCRTFCG